MLRKNKESILGQPPKRNAVPLRLALVAAGALQDRPPKLLERRAMRKIGNKANKSFSLEPLSAEQLHELGDAYENTTYWHGTGRYQRHGDKQVDVLQAIIESQAINIALDAYDPDLGLKKTASLATTRLYGRAYADIHSDKIGELKRFISPADAANFYIVRPALQYIYQQSKQHPKGYRAGYKEIQQQMNERRSALAQSWQAKVTSRPIKEMQVFSAGSDIADNYPIVLGLDDSVETIQISSALSLTREKRVDKPITLDHLTHIEVPRERVAADSAFLTMSGLSIPVFAIEDMEQYAARQGAENVLLGNR